MNYFVGIDIGGTNVEIGILNAQGDILGKESIKTESKKGAEDTFNRIWNKTKELAEKLKIKVEDIEAIGLGIPGPVVNNSVVKIAANFSWNNDFPAKDLMEKVTGKPVKVGNDVKVIALGETLFGAGKGYKNSITIPIGTGIAAGIIIDGKILEGAGGAAGEFGHVVVNKEGYKCGCGLTGCLETYCSATGIVREGRRRLELDKNNALYEVIGGDLEKLEAKHIFDLAKKGDKFSSEIVDFFCEKLAEGVGMLLNIINPEIIIFTGGVARAGEIITDGVKKYLPKYALGMTMENLIFTFGKLEEEAGIKGAAALVMNK
ncbi:MAG: ROK family protein [Fusobacterium mortiferum]|jgi:glucokinase|uniref:ROK family protein n=2 Tax=Fusobacterium mortiferum TaxID=850 RepID=A0A414PZG5_FUSMR|nr:ROK family protein [Fusobacterium mortiferum]AVQ18415.1 ROK family protein [Fusobacterium mortiferum ATCC 9817]EEO34651.1 putative glucokinase [Fusobacterium mortiferum ATCC 9817]MCF2626505.1 ROK family protein [Fusobacterium mortiferum]MCI7187299.1 ROK family protein [Fusobacterium mortiferum]RGN01156.1 ROK family protein [Fusobacterium mortiferum]